MQLHEHRGLSCRVGVARFGCAWLLAQHPSLVHEVYWVDSSAGCVVINCLLTHEREHRTPQNSPGAWDLAHQTFDTPAAPRMLGVLGLLGFPWAPPVVGDACRPAPPRPALTHFSQSSLAANSTRQGRAIGTSSVGTRPRRGMAWGRHEALTQRGPLPSRATLAHTSTRALASAPAQLPCLSSSAYPGTCSCRCGIR